jgi:glycosyltransferase involved in cell wall biosynthesis
MYGGSQRSVAQLAKLLAQRGHDVGIHCGFIGRNGFGILQRVRLMLSRRLVVNDQKSGVDTWRSLHPWETLEETIESFWPDVVIVPAAKPVLMAKAAQRFGLPVVMMLQDVDFSFHHGDIRELSGVAFVANSRFTARVYKEAFGIDADVIYPPVNKRDYLTEAKEKKGNCVTFINPHPYKGANVALDLAGSLPNVNFMFVRGWPLDPDYEKELIQKIRKLSNVRLVGNTIDMRSIYTQTRVLLVPSQWEEGYGRVAAEAQVNGIPVIASNIGGLPESVGPGGILISPHAPIEEWSLALNELLSNSTLYDRLSGLAIAHTNRAEIDIDHQAELWEQVLFKAVRWNGEPGSPPNPICIGS